VRAGWRRKCGQKSVVRHPGWRELEVWRSLRGRARNMVRRYLDLLLIFAACDTDQACIVRIVRQALAVVSELVDPASGTGAAFWLRYATLAQYGALS
jgi:hypothetical protein